MLARTLKILAAAVAVALLFAACGDDDGGAVRQEGGSSSSGSASGTGTEATGEQPPVQLEGEVNNHGTGELEDHKLELEADDFYFNPTFVKVSGGGTATVEIENEGDTAHTFTIDGQDVDVTLQPGEKQEVEVKLPDSGQLQYYCRFHVGQGMQGAFYVGS